MPLREHYMQPPNGAPGNLHVIWLQFEEMHNGTVSVSSRRLPSYGCSTEFADHAPEIL